jgi:antirestriction protein ArdC
MTESVVSFADLLRSAVTEPGIIATAYRQFHNYSFGNMLLAHVQCMQRGLQPGPIATFPRWKDLGRYVRKGERAITLCMPVTVKRPAETDGTGEDPIAFTRFVFRRNWFVLSQTEGGELPPAALPTWDAGRALATLLITEVPFEHLDGNCLGYARERSIAISPINPLPHKTRFHEIGHVLLGHTAEGVQADGEITPRNLREVEAESVALLCCAALDLPGAEFSRGYIQSWWKCGNAIPERSAQRILKAADQILRAGRPTVEEAL